MIDSNEFQKRRTNKVLDMAYLCTVKQLPETVNNAPSSATTPALNPSVTPLNSALEQLPGFSNAAAKQKKAALAEKAKTITKAYVQTLKGRIKFKKEVGASKDKDQGAPSVPAILALSKLDNLLDNGDSKPTKMLEQLLTLAAPNLEDAPYALHAWNIIKIVPYFESRKSVVANLAMTKLLADNVYTSNVKASLLTLLPKNVVCKNMVIDFNMIDPRVMPCNSLEFKDNNDIELDDTISVKTQTFNTIYTNTVGTSSDTHYLSNGDLKTLVDLEKTNGNNKKKLLIPFPTISDVNPYPESFEEATVKQIYAPGAFNFWIEPHKVNVTTKKQEKIEMKFWPVYLQNQKFYRALDFHVESFQSQFLNSTEEGLDQMASPVNFERPKKSQAKGGW